MSSLKRFIGCFLAITAAVSLSACNININDGRLNDAGSDISLSDNAVTEENAEILNETEKNGDVIILFTNDVHCGVDQGFGYAGLKQIRDRYEALGYTTILVDNGDSIQGETLGTLSRGEVMIDLMNDMGYDVAIPGNHEFDYGMNRFFELTEMADFPYISCNFTHVGEKVFDPYVIKEAAGIKIAFVGVTTPMTKMTSTPHYFQNNEGEYIYDFCGDETGGALYEAVQNAVDSAREEGADYVYVMSHLGNETTVSPWMYNEVIENTSGIDVFLDGHSHDTEQVVMKDKDGADVVRSSCGTKLNCIGYSHISKDDGIVETDILRWPNKESAPELLGIRNEIQDKIDAANDELDEALGEKIASSLILLTVNDPVEKDKDGDPIRVVRFAETNLGDFCTDALRTVLGSDVAVLNSGGIRAEIDKGDITYGDIINVFPYDNELCVIEVTGQQLLDALEWGAKDLPEENGGFLQVSGMTYEADPSVKSGCESDENGMCTGIKGERRVKNVTVGGEAIDPQKKYTVGGINYTLLNHGDGYTAFDGAKIIKDKVMLDNQGLIDYIVNTLNGGIGEEYANPYGEGRITIINDGSEGED